MQASMTLFNSLNPKDQPARVFIGLDGRWLVNDNLGTRPATPLAVALTLLPSRRVVGYRAEVANG